MKKKRFTKTLSLLLTAGMVFSSGSLSALASERALQSDFSTDAVFHEARAAQEVTKITPDKTSGEINKFIYTAYSGKSWVPSASEAYIDLGASDSRARECYYEIPFVGSGINIFAIKGPNHGKVEFSVDGENIQTVSLYNASRTSAQSVYSVTGLAEGSHVLKAVTLPETDSSAVVNQVAYAEITHAPYIPEELELTNDSYTLLTGETQQILYRAIPDYTSFTDMAFVSSDESVASVSADGVITAKKAGGTVITLSSALTGITETVSVNVTGTPMLAGSIVDTNTQYTQDRYAQVKGMTVTSKSLTAWKNDKAVSELALLSRGVDAEHVSITASSLASGSNSIPASNVSAVFIKSVKAYNGSYLGYGSTTRPVPAPTESNRSESSDILYQTEPLDLPQNTVQPVWVSFDIPEDAAAGTYTGTLTVTAENPDTPLVFTYQIEVQDAVLPDASEFADGFDIELWQYPYSSAEYYGVEPFSEEHLKLMESGMLKYKEVGGHAITTSVVEEAWSGQTYSKNEVHYPSMVKWTKESNGTFTYDYTDFDKWVEFNKKLGIGDKIVLYSIAPWHDSFTYWENGTLKYESFSAGTARYKEVWKPFLEDLIEHLMAKGWFEDSYIGIDERGFSAAAFDLIESVRNIHGETLKTAGAMDGFMNKKDLALRVTDLNVGDTAAAAHPAEFAQLVKDREALGYRTTLYSCTEHQPGNFSLSAPVESYWSVANAAKMGTVGFMRWAYDAWVEDPLNDTTHNSFEPGDCFLIYPDKKDAADPTSKSSVRLEKMAEGVRDVNKLMQIAGEVPSLQDKIDDAYANFTITGVTSHSYLSADKVAQLSNEADAFKEDLNEISEEYIALKASGTDQVESLTIAEGSDAKLEAGDTLQLNAVLKPDSLLNKGVTWTSSKPNIVSVSSRGLVTAKKLGSAVITAVSQQDSTKKASITVQVVTKDIEDSAKVAYYSFNEMNGNVIADGWGHRNGASSGASLSKGKSGNALTVTEAEKSVQLDGASGLGDTWTVGFWVNSSAAGDARNSILMSSDKNYSFDARLASDRPKSGVHVGTGTGDVLTFNYDFPADTWVHMAWTQDKTNGLTLYINGSPVQTNNWTASHNFPCPIDLIGGTGFTGKIDELKVYNRVLNESEIGIIMQIDGLNVPESSKELFEGDIYSIDAVLISNQEDKTLTYTSDAPQIASVDEDGMVTAHKKGTAVITVENKAGGFSETVTITVVKKLNISNRLPVYELGEKYLSTIDKDENNEKGRRYLGQPDMVMLDDNKTLITAYPKGHGKGPLIMKVSNDAGETWTEKTDIPSSWAGSQETPTMYKLHLADGKQRLMLITACPGWGTDSAGHQTGWNTSYSDDGGKTWTEYKHWYTNHSDGSANNAIVAMASLVQLKDGSGNDIQKWMGVYHNYGYVNYKTYLTFDENGKEQWSEPEPYLSEYRSIESSYQMCEIGMFRSPDGKRIVGLARSQSHNNPATLIYSDDEGETWSRPMDLPGSLAGERHKALYDPISGRLIITFREISYDQNGNNQFDGGDDWICGDWGAWVGTYEDLINQEEGQYRILLDEDWANNAKSGDTGYTGMVVLPDGTFVLDTYGHWDKDFSMSWGGGVTTDLCYIRQAKFKLSDLEADHGITADFSKLNAAIKDAEKLTSQGSYTDDSWAAFQDALTAARNTAGNSSSTQAEINAARDTLIQAMDSLQTKPDIPQPDKSALTSAVSSAGAIGKGNYTDDCWAAFQNALSRARIILASSSSTQADLDAALTALNQAQAGLRLKPVTPPGGGSEKPITVQAPASMKTASPGYDQIKITWTKVPNAAGYELYRSNKKSGTYTKIRLPKVSQLTYTDKKLKTGTAYFYKVRAYAADGTQTVYSPYTAVKSCKPVPAKPILSSVKNLSGNKARLKWKKVTGSSGYDVYRSVKKNGKYKKVKPIKKGKTLTYTDSAVTAKKTYYYKVRACRKIGKKTIAGPFSNPKPVKIKK